MPRPGSSGSEVEDEVAAFVAGFLSYRDMDLRLRLNSKKRLLSQLSVIFLGIPSAQLESFLIPMHSSQIL